VGKRLVALVTNGNVSNLGVMVMHIYLQPEIFL
jgi:hypothetical protein